MTTSTVERQDYTPMGWRLVCQWEREAKERREALRPPITLRAGIPDECLFVGTGTMAECRVPVVEHRALFTDLGRFEMGVSPRAAVPCVVTRWVLP